MILERAADASGVTPRLVMNAGDYQLAFRTPGIIPESDRSRKQIRQMPNFRRNARERPHRPQRLCCRTWNFGLRLDFSIMAFRAIQKHSVFLSHQPTANSHNSSSSEPSALG